MENKRHLIALVDGDVLTYSIPFSLQEGKGKEAKLKQEAEKFLGVRIDEFIESILKETGANDYKVFINGKDNFRMRYETYKANRSSMEKPILHHPARDYLVNHHFAIIVDNMESDDALAIEQTQSMENDFGHETIICSIDKDLKQVAGKHYRWPIPQAKDPKPELFEVTEQEGLVSLYRQALTGDKVDNIGYVLENDKWVKAPYLRGLGDAKAKKIVTEDMSEKEMYEAVLEVYTSKEGTEQNLVDNMNMLYMLRSEDDEYRVPD